MKRCHSFIFKFLNFNIVAISMVMVFTLSGCIEEYDADIPSDDSDLLVVEGTICSSQLNKFILSRTQPVNSLDSPRMVKGAKVSVLGSDGSEYVAQEGNGYYSCWIDALASDVEYRLHIESEGETYESVPQKPLPTERIAEVNVLQDTPKSDLDVLITPDAPFDPEKVNYYSWTYVETWEVHPDYRTYIYFDLNTLKPVFAPYQFPECGWKDETGSTIMVGSSLNYEGQHIRQLKLYDIGHSDERMFYKYSGLVKQRAITKAEYEYELARRQAGSEMGGLFTPLPSALPTNIRCLTSQKHVIGFVGCSINTAEYRFFLYPEDYSIDYPPIQDSRIWLDDCTEADCYRMVDEDHMYLCEWEDERLMPGGKLRTAWANKYQLDVRLRGAYVEKPEFWGD
jgi:hypothetical protein